MLLLFRRVRVTLCNQVLPPAEGDDAVPMSELLARAEMEAKAESASQVRAVADCMLPDALFCYAPLRHNAQSYLTRVQERFREWVASAAWLQNCRVKQTLPSYVKISWGGSNNSRR